MNFFELTADPKDTQYTRLVSDVLRTLRSAVDLRVRQGETQAAIAQRAGMDKAQLSRLLNARVANLTAKTISNVLFACRHEPTRFAADPVETIVTPSSRLRREQSANSASFGSGVRNARMSYLNSANATGGRLRLRSAGYATNPIVEAGLDTNRARHEEVAHA